MKRIFRHVPLLALAFAPICVHAQTSVEASVGFGTAFDSASGAGIENVSSANAFGACNIASNDGFCQATPSLGGLFMNLSGDIMLTKRFGAGAGISFRPTKADYGPLQYRQTFIDFNGIYAPITRKRWGVQLLGGIGSARTSFSYSQSSCVGTAVCTSQSQAVGSTNHFQVHGGVGVEIFLNEHIFVRPQFDLHYVPNFTQQFGSNAAPMTMISVGYSSGSRE